MLRIVRKYFSIKELALEVHEQILKGRLFVSGLSISLQALRERDVVLIALEHPVSGELFEFEAEAVWIGAEGIGLAILTLPAEKKEILTRFAHFVRETGVPTPKAVQADVSKRVPSVSSSGERPVESPALYPSVPVFDAFSQELSDLQSVPNTTNGSDSLDELDEPGVEHAQAGTSQSPFRNVHERVRSLSLRERDELARRGSMPERVALERAFGSSVFESLLQNPQLSIPEVARIAKNGSLPRPLVGVIVSNSAWLSATEVQRALLSNPRCSGVHLDRVLALIKPAELMRLSQSCPYRQEVKAAIVRLVRKGTGT